MRLLLDTHIFLWAIVESPLLKPAMRRVIESSDQVYVSAASIWEIAIKARLSKITADLDEVVTAIEESGFLELPVRAAHAAEVAKLPLYHNDPFDRILVAQAITEPLKLLTSDGVLARYSDVVIFI